MATKQIRRLEVNEDLAFQHRDWRVQRVGWALLALIVVAALAGILGPGPLSHRQSGSANGLQIEYERFVRHAAQTELKVRVDATALQSDYAKVAISRDYLDSLNLQQVTPSPVRVEARQDALVYVFESPASAGLVDATFELEPDKFWAHAGSVSLNGGPAVPIEQFTYP